MTVTEMLINPKFTAAGAYWALLIPGYSLVLATVIALGLYSRNVTIAYRLLMIGLACWMLARLARQNREWTWPLLLGGFFVVYSARVLIEAQGNRLGRPAEEYLLYLWGTVFLPSLGAYVLGCCGKAARYDALAFLFLTGCFAFVSWRFWGGFLEAGDSARGREDVISGLTLSYLGSATLLVGAWAVARIPGWRWKVCASVAGLSGLIPLYLGASRGPLVAMVLTGAAYALRSLGTKQSRVRALFSGVFLVLFLTMILVLLVKTDSGSTNRVGRMQDEYETGSSSMARLELYEYAVREFAASPLFGRALEVRPGAHPHNIILEALMSCGVLGSIYIWFLVSGASKAFMELDNPLVGWLGVLLFVYLTGNMFSGALWASGITTSLVMYFHGRRVHARIARNTGRVRAVRSTHPRLTLPSRLPGMTAMTPGSHRSPLAQRG